MPPKARYNDKARAGGLAKAQAIREARKHGRKLPQGEQPKSKKQKRLEKYVDGKLRTDEKVKLIEKLSSQSKTTGLSSTKVMKRTKGQEKKQIHDTFNGFDDEEDEDSSGSDTDGGEFYLNQDHSDPVGFQIVQGSSNSQPQPQNHASKKSSTSFGFVPNQEPVKKIAKKATLKYNWRAKLEEDKKRKHGFVSEDSSDSGSVSESSGVEQHDDSRDDCSSSDEGHEAEINEKRAAFKDWAAAQTGSQVQNLPALSSLNDPATETYVPRPRSKSPEAEDISDLRPPSLMPVLIERTDDINEARANLPAYAHEQEIVEKIKSHSTVIISGATGSGKTTQIPQFLFEAGFKGIGITQPRRVAAVSMARRVATEMGSQSAVVGYQIRFESNVKANTAVKFMTDGVLLRELSVDFMLSKYEVLIIDEAHERSINTDILIGVLSRVSRLRKDTEKPLRLVIMSATLRVSDFAENKRLFNIPPPIMSIESRQYPVTVHFSKRTEMSSYVEEAFKKVCKIHQKLPPGGILVFLTGQQEIQQCSKLLYEHFGKRVIKYDEVLPVNLQANEQILETEDYSTSKDATETEKRANIDVDDYDDAPESDVSDIEETEADKAATKAQKEQKFVQILPLYSLLPTTEQLKVFRPAPDQCRQIILATNVAETSLTIPGIRYVVDSGRAKSRKYDGRIQSFEIDWISKASADQRSGRAGRTGPGHSYRLFSSAVYDSSFPTYSDAEILHTPIDGIVLQMKGMNIHTVINFPFPTPPDRSALADAEKLLLTLGALDKDGKITDLGRQMSLFPLSPRYAKMVVIANQQGLLPYVVALVAAMSVDDIFIRAEAIHDDDQDDTTTGYVSEERKRKRQAYFRAMSKFTALSSTSDAMRVLMAVCASDYSKDLSEFCREHFLRHKAMEEIRKLRSQISGVIRNVTSIDLSMSLKLKLPDQEQIVLLHQILGAAFVDQICVRADLVGKEPLQKGNLLRIPYVPLAPLALGQEYAFIHPSCYSIKNASTSEPPAYLIYSSLSASPNNPDTVRIKVIAPIEPAWIAEFAKDTPLLKHGKPLLSSLAHIRSLDGGQRREVPVIPSLQLNGSGRQPWALPPVKITQRLVGSRWIDE